MSKHKLNVGLVFGGESSEHEVSILSAKTIYNALSHSQNHERFIVHPLYIDKNGFWEDHEYSTSILFEDKMQNSIILMDKDVANNLTESELIHKMAYKGLKDRLEVKSKASNNEYFNRITDRIEEKLLEFKIEGKIINILK